MAGLEETTLFNARICREMFNQPPTIWQVGQGCNFCAARLNPPSAVAALSAAPQFLSLSITIELVKGNRRFPHQGYQLSFDKDSRNWDRILCYRKTRLFALNVFNDGLETAMRFRLLEMTIMKQKLLQNYFKTDEVR